MIVSKGANIWRYQQGSESCLSPSPLSPMYHLVYQSEVVLLSNLATVLENNKNKNAPRISLRTEVNVPCLIWTIRTVAAMISEW